MAIFGWLGRQMVRPYAELGKVAKDFRSVKGHFQAAREAREARRQNITWIDATDEGKRRISEGALATNRTASQQAFEIIYEDNGWDEKQIAEQIKGVWRAKMVALILLWLSLFSIGVLIIYVDNLWFLMFSIVMALISAMNFLVRFIKYTIFRAQLECRDLMTLREFWARGDRWIRIFG